MLSDDTLELLHDDFSFFTRGVGHTLVSSQLEPPLPSSDLVAALNRDAVARGIAGPINWSNVLGKLMPVVAAHRPALRKMLADIVAAFGEATTADVDPGPAPSPGPPHGSPDLEVDET
jgi:hypothetical protein